MPRSEDPKKDEPTPTGEPVEDDALSHDVPTDLMVLHEVIEWNEATK